ncbi:MAG: hypothetical protein KY464_17655, partial [Gemmatimonadetes bacterium]|nr:hypothetical protein [Gemmatimonadota bacterium]
MDAEPNREPAPTTFNVLFVCTGNTCRSPMAAALARDELAHRGWQHVEIASAGAAADPGEAASKAAVAVMGRSGIDLSGHSSQRLTAGLVAWADLILVMSPAHLHAVADLGGAEKMALLGEFGATLMFAGNFIGRTQTMPLAILGALETDLDAALALSVLLVVLSFAVL